MGLTAVATELLAQREQVASTLALPILGFHGLPAMARLVAGFGVGLLVGAIVPRSLPALLLGAVLCLALTTGVAWAFDAWLGAQPSQPQLDGNVKWTANGRWTQVAPDGSLVTDPAAFQGDGDYIPMGIPESDAIESWLPFDLLLYAGIGAVGVAAAFVVVDRRRPTT
jgi:hypothetical protein